MAAIKKELSPEDREKFDPRLNILPVDDITEAARIAAVKRDGLILELIESASRDVQMAAVKQNGLALRFIESQTELLQMAALRNNAMALEFAIAPSLRAQTLAIGKFGAAIQFADPQTEELCHLAVGSHVGGQLALGLIKNPSEAVVLKSLRLFGATLEHVANPSETMIQTAIQSNCWMIQTIENPSEAVCLIAVRKAARTLEHIKNPSEEVCRTAVEKHPRSLRFIENPSRNVLLTGIRGMGLTAIGLAKKLPDEHLSLSEAIKTIGVAGASRSMLSAEEHSRYCDWLRSQPGPEALKAIRKNPHLFSNEYAAIVEQIALNEVAGKKGVRAGGRKF